MDFKKLDKYALKLDWLLGESVWIKSRSERRLLELAYLESVWFEKKLHKISYLAPTFIQLKNAEMLTIKKCEIKIKTIEKVLENLVSFKVFGGYAIYRQKYSDRIFYYFIYLTFKVISDVRKNNNCWYDPLPFKLCLT